MYKVSQEKIDELKTKEDTANFIALVANYHVLEVDETYAWSDLAHRFGLVKDDFYDDQAETIARYELEAVTHYGIVNWKYKG